MNEQTIFSHGRFQEFYTAREMAEIALKRGITTFPATERGVRKLAETSGWNSLPSNLCRPREGKGGGREYHFTLMPQVMRDAIAAWGQQAMLANAHQVAQDADERRLNALRLSALAPRPRMVAQARTEILRSIDGYAISRGQKRSWAIRKFLEAQAEYHLRQKIEKKRDVGFHLDAVEVNSLASPPLLTALDGFQLEAGRLAVANDRRDDARISRTAIYSWFKSWDENGALALAPTPPRQDQEIPPAFKDFLKFYAKPSKPSVPRAYAAYVKAASEAEGVQRMTLTLDQVQYILRHKLNNIEKNVGREGMLTLRSRLPYITRTTEDMWPTTIYTADGKTFDAEVADPVTRLAIRPEITSVLDVATRKCVGYALSRKENFVSVSDALRRSVSAHGVCAIFYTDRGAGYKNKNFDDAIGGLMGRLGITKMHALPYNSQAKGIIERFNHTWNDLAREYPTYISKEMDKEAKHEVHKETRGEIKLFGTARRLPSWEQFIADVERTIAEYNDRPHSGLPRFEDPETGKLRHMSPNEFWATHVSNGFEPVTIDQDEADDLFRPYEIRSVSRAQVTLRENTYFDEKLTGYHKQQVMVGYDYHQADKVWVREFDVETGQPGKLICVAGFMANTQRYVPVPFEQDALEKRAKARRKRAEGKLEAIDAELRAPYLLEQQAAPITAEIFDLREPEAVVAAPMAVTSAPVADNVKNIVDAKPKRRTFRSDEELAAWALQHPDQLSANQIKVLRSCISSPAARDLFRMSGIDVEALRTLLRAVA